MPTHQPSGMQNTTGVILTIGCVCNGDRTAIVIPLCSEAGSMSDEDFCQDACTTFQLTAMMTSLLAMMSSDAYVSFVQAQGMVDGMAPFRDDYPPMSVPGTGASPPMPSNICGLAYWYEDTDDVVIPKKLRVARNFIPAVPVAEVTGDKVSSGYKIELQSFTSGLQVGFDSTIDPSVKWYRVLAAPTNRAPGTPVNRTFQNGGRGYVATQRRRLIPR